ncbi:hypothetical protein EDI_087100 [Entamoeba dispar SAW760]|uniref:Uncharacterized protein n=1 Tax=Entamoeba dispar (strain ATCC PRA-260 / SAW760) TaxID=370354 RepID=B0ELE0_ENTDS|nr:uncharacterized protein EDI_087100 [Entamoeba dispar SAW760]EDR24662.1 hypothetical protein EDI_087100 [Entamoeba dispar SAW760]|eukprot:EDR24662.1 hypothetical protein EDI_087100 [Entamoeba dispar SAW760]
MVYQPYPVRIECNVADPEDKRDGYMVVNQSIEGYVSGTYPVYIQAFSGNTFGETEATKMNELIFTDSIYKTVLNSETKEVINKEVIKGNTVIDGSSLKNGTTILQLGHIAIAIRKDDFKCKYISGSTDSTGATFSIRED